MRHSYVQIENFQERNRAHHEFWFYLQNTLSSLRLFLRCWPAWECEEVTKNKRSILPDFALSLVTGHYFNERPSVVFCFISPLLFLMVSWRISIPLHVLSNAKINLIWPIWWHVKIDSNDVWHLMTLWTMWILHFCNSQSFMFVVHFGCLHWLRFMSLFSKRIIVVLSLYHFNRPVFDSRQHLKIFALSL